MNRFVGLIGNEIAEVEALPVDRLTHPDASQATQFWAARPADGIRIGRDVPSRRIARLLSRAVVCDPVRGGEDFRIHISGGAVNHRFGFELTGRHVSEIFDNPAELSLRLGAMNAAMETGEPRMMRIVHRCGGVELMCHEVMALPVTAPNGKDRWVLVFAFYF